MFRFLENFVYFHNKNMDVNTNNCIDMDGTEKFNCECNDGFEGERCEKDKCEGVICENGSCYSGTCICDDGYINIEGDCEETCAVNPCQELIQT